MTGPFAKDHPVSLYGNCEFDFILFYFNFLSSLFDHDL
jgi:hypothetical protein